MTSDVTDADPTLDTVPTTTADGGHGARTPEKEERIMARRFEDKTALVTGGASGIGRAVALALADEGANVVVNDLHLAPAQAVVEEITARGARAFAVAGDVAVADDVKNAVAQTVAHFGALHCAFNNAGIGGPLGPLTDISIEGYHQLMAVNLHSVFYGMFYEIPEMLKVGGGS
ncbi:MAG: SDR family NAD(P)-dependent oxidoreductase, partial [Acidobacteriota bacterium]|nr:SDR family NAD(P)-dependent oxidoreductase [Acidobacteriota bacterium]